MAKEFYVCASCGEPFRFDLDDVTIDPDPYHYPDGDAYYVICPHCGRCACYLSEEEYNEIIRKAR